MNYIIENFIYFGGQSFGDKNHFKFATNMDGVTIEDNNTTGQDRLVRSSFQLLVHGYLLPKEIASHSKKDISEVRKIINKDILIFVLENIKKKKIKETQIKQVLESILEGESLEKSILFETDVDSVEEKIVNLIKEKPGLAINALS